MTTHCCRIHGIAVRLTPTGFVCGTACHEDGEMQLKRRSPLSLCKQNNLNLFWVGHMCSLQQLQADMFLCNVRSPRHCTGTCQTDNGALLAWPSQSLALLLRDNKQSTLQQLQMYMMPCSGIEVYPVERATGCTLWDAEHLCCILYLNLKLILRVDILICAFCECVA